MRKNTLIKILQEIEGNPEIDLWNGYVQDYMKIGDIVPIHLFKMTLKYYLEVCRLEACRDRKDWDYQHSPERLEYLKNTYKRVVDWEDNEYITEDDVKSGRYTTKRVFAISPKLRGKTAWDRLGSVKY